MLIVSSDSVDMELGSLPTCGQSLVSLTGDEVFQLHHTTTQEIWEKFEVLDDCPINEFYEEHPPSFLSLKKSYHDPILDMIDLEFQQNIDKSRPEILHHDCMWGGTCASKAHLELLRRKLGSKADGLDAATILQQSSAAFVLTTPKRFVSNTNNQTSSSRSLLINSQNNQQIKNNIRHDHSFSKGPKIGTNQKVQHYETPEVSSEDDSMDCNPQLQQIVDYITSEKHTVIQILEALSSAADIPETEDAELSDYLSSNLEEEFINCGESSASSVSSSGTESSESESDQCDYNEYDEYEYVQEVHQTPPTTTKNKNKNVKNKVVVTPVMPDHAYHRSPESDHCYHISEESSKRFENLGVDTPSDSEEEIDVVNVYNSEAHHQMLRQYHQKTPTPTNTSRKGRHIQQTTEPTTIRRRTVKVHIPKKQKNRPGRKATTTVTVPTPLNEYYMQENDDHSQQQSVTANYRNSKDCSNYSNNNRNTKKQQQANKITPPATPQAEPAKKVAAKRRATNNSQKSTNAQAAAPTEDEATPAKRTYRPRKPKQQGEGETTTDSDSDHKRNLHNDMERLRRVDLRRAFDGLHSLLPPPPPTKGNGNAKERTAKVNILSDASVFIHKIKEEEKTLIETKLELKRDQESLKDRVSFLRRLLALNR